MRLIGSVTYQSTAAQDLAREQGGLAQVLNLCRPDANNPSESQSSKSIAAAADTFAVLREYAILALRNMLRGNLRSQDFVSSLRPRAVVREDGTLEDI